MLLGSTRTTVPQRFASPSNCHKGITRLAGLSWVGRANSESGGSGSTYCHAKGNRRHQYATFSRPNCPTGYLLFLTTSRPIGRSHSPDSGLCRCIVGGRDRRDHGPEPAILIHGSNDRKMSGLRSRSAGRRVRVGCARYAGRGTRTAAGRAAAPGVPSGWRAGTSPTG